MFSSATANRAASPIGRRLVSLDYLRQGDTLEVRRLDRLASSERILIETLQDLDARPANIVSLTEPMFDATSPMGRALFEIVPVFTQLRVDTVRGNTHRGDAET